MEIIGNTERKFRETKDWTRSDYDNNNNEITKKKT